MTTGTGFDTSKNRDIFKRGKKKPPSMMDNEGMQEAVDNMWQGINGKPKGKIKNGRKPFGR